MISRNPQALYILRNLGKFENSTKIYFSIREIPANFNNFQRRSTSGQKLLLTWCCTCIYQLPKALRLRKNVSQINFCNIVFGFHCLHLDCVLFGGRNNPNFNRKKSILVWLKFKIWLCYMKELWFFLTRSEISALRILKLTKNKILNIATRATVSDKNVKCKQSENWACKKRRKSHQSYF